MKSLLTSYTCGLIIEQFPWQSPIIKEKTSMAAFLCDINLTCDEFKAMEESSDQTYLSKRVLNHPTTIAETLKQRSSQLSHETITIISEHHERPDGSGYPGGLDHQRINLLSAVHIVARDFVSLLIEKKFDAAQKNEILAGLKRKYHQGNFKKATEAIINIF
jgi:response regulator RpfG family c-di-GMP phosphodiesterase